MRNMTRYTWVLFAGLILTSCFTTQTVPIDQMEPGKVSLSPQIRKAALISRNFKFAVDTLSGYYILDFKTKRVSKKENQGIDSLAVNKSLEGLRKAILESGRFDEVYVYPYGAINPHVGTKELPLSPAFIQSLCRESQTDAVISLEMLSFFYSRHKGSADKAIQPEANVKITAIWSVYTPKSEVPLDRFTHSEVIRWNESDPNNSDQKFVLPGRKEAISIACALAAKNYSKRVVPYWSESKRVLLGLNEPDWETAFSYASKSKWEAASAIWQKYTASKQKRVAGMAALNYAVAQEMLGDPDQATVWSDKSVALLKNGEAGRIARGYAALLHERKLKAARLNILLKNK